MERQRKRNTKDNFDFNSVCKYSNDIFSNHLSRRPANLHQFISGEVGTNTRTLMSMLNEGPANSNETIILDYYIWKVATPLLKNENHKMQAEMIFAIPEEDQDD